MNSYKVVFTTERGLRHQQKALELAPTNLHITMLRNPDREELLKHLPEADYWISERAGIIDDALIKSALRLKLILRLGSLTHDIDIAAARAAGVIVCTWPVGGAIRVAEHCILQMLALCKRLRELESVTRQAGAEWGDSRRTNEDTFAYNWSQRQGVIGLWQQTVGILGFGEIGAELARRLHGWDCTVRYHKRRRLPVSVEEELGIHYIDCNSLFAHSDHVVNLLPYFPETDLWLNADRLSKMKPGAFLSSCGSGSVVNEADVADALATGRLAGVALDAFEWEPLRPDNPLLELARSGHNVLLTPHTAAGADNAYAQERRMDYTNIVNHIQGHPLLHRVD